jgi:hypothetical protein
VGLKHKAKKGTVIEANGVTVVVLQGTPRLEITAPPNVPIKTSRVAVSPPRRPRRRAAKSPLSQPKAGSANRRLEDSAEPAPDSPPRHG